ncbi:hypothetical protein GC207_12795 [bacterium]|nr:hypothetical protein [bacterium]
MKDQLSRPSNRRLQSILGTVGVIAVILIAAAVGRFIGHQGTKALFSGDSATSATAGFTEASWGRRTIQDIALDAPFDFAAGPDVSARIPVPLRDSIEYFQTFQGHGSDGFTVGVSRIAYKPQVEVTLDGSVHGAVTQVAAAVGDSDPQYTASKTTISGLEARSVSYQTPVSGRTMHINAAFVHQGQKLWQVQVLYWTDSTAADASRILRSIEVTP